MSKRSKESEKGGAASVAEPDFKVPDRTIGFSVLAAIVIFVAIFMFQQDAELETANAGAASEVVSTDPRFNSEGWYLPSDALLGFVRIPAGTFVMGSNPALDRMAYENERWSANRRQGSVDVAEFYISRYEVTNAQFNLFLQERRLPWASEVSSEFADHPVTNITWPEALAYARWLERKLLESNTTPASLKQLLQAGGSVSLPTEAQWEKAARGDDGRIFPWGPQPRSDRAHFSATSTVAVGSVRCDECANGLSDMSGNVWELTRSPFQNYPYDEADDAIVSATDALWVMRGGSYSDEINNVRAAIRGGVDPGVRSGTIGFRVVINSP